MPENKLTEREKWIAEIATACAWGCGGSLEPMPTAGEIEAEVIRRLGEAEPRIPTDPRDAEIAELRGLLETYRKAFDDRAAETDELAARLMDVSAAYNMAEDDPSEAWSRICEALDSPVPPCPGCSARDEVLDAVLAEVGGHLAGADCFRPSRLRDRIMDILTTRPKEADDARSKS